MSEEDSAVIDVPLGELTHPLGRVLCIHQLPWVKSDGENVQRREEGRGKREEGGGRGEDTEEESPLGVARDSNLMSSGLVSISMSTNNRSASEKKLFQSVLTNSLMQIHTSYRTIHPIFNCIF